MSDEILNDISHRRYNPLRGSWILVSPHRTKRPWQGQQESPTTTDLPTYDPKCYLCPGNVRANGAQNPQYEDTFVFVNDFAAVTEEQQSLHPEPYVSPHPAGSTADLLLRAEPESGKCYVLTFSRAHNLTLADMSPEEILKVVQMWTEIYAAHVAPDSPLAGLVKTNFTVPGASTNNDSSDRVDNSSNNNNNKNNPSVRQYRHMQIFENKGSAMGCSNPHPHGQIWIQTSLPEEPALELHNLTAYHAKHNSHLLLDYARMELAQHEKFLSSTSTCKSNSNTSSTSTSTSTSISSSSRVISSNPTFLTLCPWWSTWPFEALIIPHSRPLRALPDLTPLEQSHLASSLSDLTIRYDNLFQTPFPYSMGIHQSPLSGTAQEIELSSLHLHFYPPLLRGASVRKFLVGYEMLAEPQRDVTPEMAAARLRACGGELYRSGKQSEN